MYIEELSGIGFNLAYSEDISKDIEAQVYKAVYRASKYTKSGLKDRLLYFA